MKQRVAVITLPVADLSRAKTFYCEGLGWTPAFENAEVIFFQLNGVVLSLFLKTAFEKDIGADTIAGGYNFALAHNVEHGEEVDVIIAQARNAGARILKEPVTPEWGGYAAYFADPDGHAWEVAYNSAWPISEEGYVTFQR
jgi:uncharacterized protein